MNTDESYEGWFTTLTKNADGELVATTPKEWVEFGDACRSFRVAFAAPWIRLLNRFLR